MGVVRLAGLRLDASDPVAVAQFWAGVLRCQTEPRRDGVIAVVPTDAANYPVFVYPAATPKQGQNRIHLDLTSDTGEAKDETIARARALGGRSVDIGQTPEEGHEVMADPEGNEFCVIEPGNGFLAGTGAIGAINCDGSQALGYFWAWALGWPLVWDQDEETAIQSPAGGSKITWSGPPLMPRYGVDRWRLEVEATEPLVTTVDRLTEHGARVVEASTDGRTVVLADPDGNHFHLAGPRP